MLGAMIAVMPASILAATLPGHAADPIPTAPTAPTAPAAPASSASPATAGASPSGLAIGSVPLHAAFAFDDPSPSTKTGRAEFGAADSLRLNLLGGVVSDLSDTTGVAVRAEFEYFMAERFSIVPVAEFQWLGQIDADDAFGAGGAVLLRWHLLHEADWTVFVDAGVGLAYLTAQVPPETNRIKFSPQIGVGFTLALDADPAAARLMGGLRWYHLSNARTAASNDGFDGAMAYLGIGLPF